MGKEKKQMNINETNNNCALFIDGTKINDNK
jgi:hypothetical protein